MEIDERMALLYAKDTKQAYASLLALEEISERSDALYPYLGEFIAMLQSEAYVLRVRGFRLLCRQAKWDATGLIDASIADVLRALEDEKPTAVRQMLQYLTYLVPHKKALCEEIRRAALAIDPGRFKDTMLPLIAKDIEGLVRCIDGAQAGA